MSTEQHNEPLPLGAAPDTLENPVAALLAPALAESLAQQPGPRSQALRGRLLERVAASRAAEAAMITARQRRQPAATLAPGVTVQTLYQARPGAALRPGEPRLARLIRLEAGTLLRPEALEPAEPGRHREWLVLQGSVRLSAQAAAGAQLLSLRDYHVVPAGHAGETWSTQTGALLFLRESDLPAQPGDLPFTVHDRQAGWPDFAPGIRRRVLWQRDGQAAMLYHAEPGAQVPQHVHGHDEECLVVQGDLFLDDVLLQTGDYQLATAGTGHVVTATDTGVVIYAHGDAELRFVA